MMPVINPPESGDRERRGGAHKASRDQKGSNNSKISKTILDITQRLKEHEDNKNEIGHRIDEIGDILRLSVDRFESKLRQSLEEHFTNEDTRLKQTLETLKDIPKSASQEEINNVLTSAEGALGVSQKYVLTQPRHGNVIEWVHETLFKEFYLRVGQSLTEHSISGRTPRITEVIGAGPNEVEITLDFLKQEEVSALMAKRFWKGITYTVEMWNGDKDDAIEIRNVQELGFSHRAFLEWRFRPGCDIKIRAKAAWNGIDGSRRSSGWGDWVTFTAPSDLRNMGVKACGVVWEKRHRGENYTVTDKSTKSVLYSGPKPYFLVTDRHKKNVVVRGSRGGNGGGGGGGGSDDKWEEMIKVRPINESPEDILNDLRLFFTDLGICKRTLTKIASLTHSDKEQRILFGNIESLDVIYSIIKRYIEEEDICEAGLDAVGNIISDNPDNRKRAVYNGYIEFIIEVIKHHIKHSVICRHGFIAISDIVYGEPENRKRAFDCGYIKLIVSVIKHHIKDSDVCEYGLAAIGNIVSNDVESQKRAVDCGYIELISSVVKQHIKNSDVCEDGLAAIGNIVSGNPENQKRAAECRYIELIVSVIKQHIMNIDVCEKGFYAIGNIVFCNMANQKRAANCRYIEFITSTVKQRIENEEICEYGLYAIGNIVLNSSENRKRAADCGCIETIVNVIKEHIGNPEVCKRGLHAINNIVTWNLNKQKRAAECGYLDLINNVIKSHNRNTQLCKICFISMREVVSGNIENMRLACERGCADLLVKAIDSHDGDQAITEDCCKCLVRILSAQEVYEKYCTSEILGKVEKAHEKYGDSKLIEKCLMCLKREIDPRAAEAVRRGICTKKTTSCGMPGCQREKKKCFCVDCSAPQKCYQCYDCRDTRMNCEVCWNTKHSGHKGIEFFDLITYG